MPRPKRPRRKSLRATVMPRSTMKHCDTCQGYDAVETYGNRAQAEQAAQIKFPNGEEVTFCTNSNGGIHVIRIRPVVVVPDE